MQIVCPSILKVSLNIYIDILIRDAAWFVTGDFNDVTNNSEKERGPERAEASFSDFRTFLSEGDLYDLQHTHW